MSRTSGTFLFMSFPFFYSESVDPNQEAVILDEETSKHVISVLRMETGEIINLTNGKGNLYATEIIYDHKKHCTVEIKSAISVPGPNRRIAIAISLLKNTGRFEWFLEKATEIGVSEIIPLICERTEKEKFRHDRMNAICISAMLQSQQCWLPVLHEPLPLNHQTIQQFNHQNKFIAHCAGGTKSPLTNQLNNQLTSSLILIGPEGDFTKEEIDLALQNDFIPVSLGETRLRSETAGIVAAALLCYM
jgi:16S rRNA (uracil1498-N3)-methyltransferase